ncbi:MAG: alpha-ketoglutarate-dependent dioxygenase AlkB [Rickettsiales bacterium]|nr:alpha-ketoglutarate-dependent dioxygenase AlkB [Rickettsiales bacterium]
MKQQALFEVRDYCSDVLMIQGLRYVSNFIATEEEEKLIHIIDKQPWLTDLKRRVQHYGYRYDYKARGLASDLYLGPIPEWLQFYCKKLQSEGYFGQMPDQVIVNEYLPGQGIAAHTDCIPCFADTIASISLGSSCLMDFSNDSIRTSHYLEPRSLLVLAGESRYQWKHGIAARKSDKVDGDIIQRARRISLTFRNVTLN